MFESGSVSCSVMSDSLQPGLLCPQGFSRQEYWSGLPCPPPVNFPDPVIEPMSQASLMSPALAGGFFVVVVFTTSATWGNLLQPPAYDLAKCEPLESPCRNLKSSKLFSDLGNSLRTSGSLASYFMEKIKAVRREFVHIPASHHIYPIPAFAIKDKQPPASLCSF